MSKAFVCLGLVCVLAAGCGGSHTSGFRYPVEQAQTVRPLKEQKLAFATADEVAVIDGGRTRVLGRVPSGVRVADIQWAGDGRSVAWATRDAHHHSSLTVFDLVSGRHHRWTEVVADGMAPSPHGVTVGGYQSFFTEYTADGGSRRVAVNVRGKPLEVEHLSDDGVYRATNISLAMPLSKRWFVAAENESRFGAHGGPHRLFEFDPTRQRLVLAGRAGYSANLVTRVDERRAMWVEISSGGACDTYYSLEGYGIAVPSLPRVENGSWQILRLVVTRAGVDVIARRIRGGWVGTTTPGCSPDPRLLRWLSFRDGRWHVRETNIVDLAVAADGSIARARAMIVDDPPGLFDPVLEYLGADISRPDGTRLRLPDGTYRLRYSPVAPMTLRRTFGHGPALGRVQHLTQQGMGPLRFGADPKELQSATATPLRFDLTARGCGTARALDPRSDPHVDVVGHLIGGHLDWLSIEARDPEQGGDPDTYGDPSDEAPIVPGGPGAVGGVRVGEPVDALLASGRVPKRTLTNSSDDTVTYVLGVGRRTLVALVNGGGIIRRLEWRASMRRARCTA